MAPRNSKIRLVNNYEGLARGRGSSAQVLLLLAAILQLLLKES